MIVDHGAGVDIIGAKKLFSLVANTAFRVEFASVVIVLVMIMIYESKLAISMLVAINSLFDKFD